MVAEGGYVHHQLLEEEKKTHDWFFVTQEKHR